jgi:hypothetical protein
VTWLRWKIGGGLHFLGACTYDVARDYRELGYDRLAERLFGIALWLFDLGARIENPSGQRDLAQSSIEDCHYH